MTRFLLGSVAALGIAGGAFLALPARAQNADRPRPERPRADPAAMPHEAGFTEAQRDQLRQLQQADMKLAIRRRADLQIARMELDELFEAATVDEKAVAAKAKVVADLEAANLRADVDHRLAVRRIVSAEQYQKMKMARPPHGDRGPQGGRGPGSPGGMGGPGFGPPPGGPGMPGGPGGPGGAPHGDDVDDLPGGSIR
jgi:Spy/CpxP family protein refolding chaperone